MQGFTIEVTVIRQNGDAERVSVMKLGEEVRGVVPRRILPIEKIDGANYTILQREEERRRLWVEQLSAQIARALTDQLFKISEEDGAPGRT